MEVSVFFVAFVEKINMVKGKKSVFRNKVNKFLIDEI
jgi:hypothetical protein